jgi:hypothetical protein
MKIFCRKFSTGWEATMYQKGRVVSFIAKCKSQLEAVKKVSEVRYTRTVSDKTFLSHN